MSRAPRDNASLESKGGRDLADADLQSILQEVDATLAIPQNKPAPQLLLCPVGLVGAGKSTVVKPLSDRLDLVRISTDEIRKRLKERGYNYLRTKEIAKILIEKYLDLRYSVAIDADCAGSTKEVISQLTENSSVKAIWIHINPPESFILHKLRTYKHTWLFKNADEAIDNYFRRKPLHEQLNLPFLYTFDPSKANLHRQVDEAIHLIQDTK